MSKFIINGPTKLSGEIKVNGAKNNALKILVASLLSNEEITINNLPNIEDVNRMIEILENLGAKTKRNLTDKSIKISTKNIQKTEINDLLARQLRSSILLVGPLLVKLGKVTLPHPGGCVIGKRPIDLFLNGFKALGATIKMEKDHYSIKVKNKLKGAKIIFPKISVTATECLMMTAVLANGVTELHNCAMEPEIPALAEYLNKNGAKIKGAGTSTIIIKGVKQINAGICNVIPDRIEAGTFAIMGILTNSEIKITNCETAHLESLIIKLEQMGAILEIGKDYIITKPNNGLKSTDITTHEYPGFPTDLQAPFTLLLTQSIGMSLVHETVFEGRLFYTDLLNQMGANIIMCDPHRVVLNGHTKLYGKKLISPDLRAGITMLLAGLIAEGETVIDNIYQIERGYEKIDERLSALGANIKRVN
ncbi:UDP-N-acetylglucosamine 1-carboxyvinyltransferase [Patescibacteria group bacterium]